MKECQFFLAVIIYQSFAFRHTRKQIIFKKKTRETASFESEGTILALTINVSFFFKAWCEYFFKHYNWLKFLKICMLSSHLCNYMQYVLRFVRSIVPLKWMKWLSCDVYLQGEDHIRCSAVSPCGEWIAYSTTSSLRLYRLHCDSNNVSITKVQNSMKSHYIALKRGKKKCIDSPWILKSLLASDKSPMKLI